MNQVNFIPPKEVYEVAPENPKERLARAGYDLPSAYKIMRSSGGEILAHHLGFPVPRKGFIWSDAGMANVLAKRASMVFFLPFADIFKGPIKFLESYLNHYTRFIDSIYFGCEQVPYFKKEYYSRDCRGIWDLTSIFLQELGINKELAEHTGKIVATMLTNDDAYRLPLLDILSSFRPREIVRNFPQFFEDAVILFCERSDNGEYKSKVKKVVKLLKYVFWLPKFRKALKVAFEKVDYSQFSVDIYDQYWQLIRKGYDMGGRSFEQRRGEWKYLIEDFDSYFNEMFEREMRLRQEQAKKT